MSRPRLPAPPRAAAGLLVALLLAVLAGCAPAAEDARPLVAYVTNGIDPFWLLAEAGAEAGAEAAGVRVTVHMPAEGATSQKRILEDLLARGVDAIAVSPANPDDQTDLLDRVAQQVPLITHDSDAPASQRLCFVGVDNYVAGQLCAELVREARPGGGEVALFVGRLEQDNARRRRQGLVDGLLGRAPDPSRFDPPDAVPSGNGWTILATLTDQFDHGKGKANVEDVLARHPEVDVLVGLFAYNTPLILEAVEGAGRTGELAVVGFDERQETLAGIRSGACYGTVVQDPWSYGYRSVEILAALLRGDDSVLPADGFVEVPARGIRRAGLDAFEAELAERRGERR